MVRAAYNNKTGFRTPFFFLSHRSGVMGKRGKMRYVEMPSKKPSPHLKIVEGRHDDVGRGIRVSIWCILYIRPEHRS